jgi:chromosome partitioning protein
MAGKGPHGGKREGAGKIPLDPTLKKSRIGIVLDRKIVEWLRAKSNYSKFVNNTLKQMMIADSSTDTTNHAINTEKAKIIALVNQAGGVAKTTLTMNLGYQLAKLQCRVLLVDLDPQASLTTFMGLESYDLPQTITHSLLNDDVGLKIYPNIHGMDLVPSNLDLSAAEFHLMNSLAREMKLKVILARYQQNYDFILIDCPPNMGILSTLALTAASHLLIPVQTHYKAFKGVEALLDTVRKIKNQVNPSLKIAGFIPTLHSNTNQDASILAALKDNLSAIAPILSPIPRATAFADASMAHKPLALHQRSHPAVLTLGEIADSLKELRND